MKYVGAMVGLSASNYLYQAATAHDWALALDRSWFQIFAIGGVWLYSAIETAHDPAPPSGSLD